MSSSPQQAVNQAGAFLRPPFSYLPRPRWHDPVLRSAFVVVGVLIAYQVAITVLRPVWSSAVTDWFRAVLAWPELIVVIYVSLWLTRAHRPEALSAWMVSAALLS